MSTFNGERYLEQQIDSILNQEKVSIQLLVRDDGSTDNTKQILTRYSNNKNVKIFFGENIGYAKSFLMLLQNIPTDVDYIAFSDQDDIWLKEKLYMAINSLENFENDALNLYYSDLTATDEKLNKLYTKSFSDRNKTLGSALTRSNIAGCTMVFNRNVANKIVDSMHKKEVYMGHDSWIYKSCIALEANIFYDKNSYILFRRHDSNTSTANKSILSLIKNEIIHLRNNLRFSERTAKNLLKAYNDEIPIYNKELLTKVIGYRKNIRNHTSLLFNTNLKTGNIILDLYTKILILLKVY